MGHKSGSNSESYFKELNVAYSQRANQSNKSSSSQKKKQNRNTYKTRPIQRNLMTKGKQNYPATNLKFGHLKIMHLNIQKGIISKKDRLEWMLEEEGPDFLLLTEHGLQQNEISCFNIQGYKLVKDLCRDTVKGGGVAIFMKQHKYFNIEKIEFLEIGLQNSIEQYLEICEVKIEINKKTYIVSCVYRSPLHNPNECFFEALEDYLHNIINLSDYLVIGGDWNINIATDTNESLQFINLLESFGLHTHINDFTRIADGSQTCIDNFVTNIKKETTVPSVIETCMSDHKAIELKINVQAEVKHKFNYSRLVNSTQIEELKIRLGRENWSDVLSETEVDSISEKFINTLYYHFDISCPKKRKRVSKKHKNKWVDKELIESKNNLLRLYDRWRTINSDTSKLTYKNAKKEHEKLVKNKKSNHILDRLTSTDNTSKESWKIIDEIRKTKSCVPENLILLKEGREITDPKETGDLLNDFYINILQYVNPNVKPQSISGYNKVTNSSLSSFNMVQETDIINVLSKLKNKKSSGIDQISTKILKACSVFISKPLVHLVNASLSSGIFPSNFKISKVKPLFKGGEKNKMTNYRPIALLPSASKVLEKIVYNQLMSYLESNNLLFENQFGFRKNRSTKLALINFVEECLNILDNKGIVIGSFADLSKAFDCVNFPILIEKLAALGISGVVLKWIKCYIYNRKQVVEVNHINSFGEVASVLCQSKTVLNGVPQGSILGPLLFLVYINDISDTLNPREVIVFADDTTLLTKNKNVKPLEIDTFIKINSLVNYFEDLSLAVNSNKTKFVTIQSSQHRHFSNFNSPNLMIGDEFIEEVEVADFLGVKLDQNLNWNQQICKISNKLASGLFVLRNIAKFKNIYLSKLIYHSLIESHINYSIVLWGAHSKTHLNKIFALQKRAIRLIKGLPPRSHCSNSFIELNIVTVPGLYIYECISYFIEHCFSNRIKLTHVYDTRFKNNRTAIQHNLKLFEEKPSFMGEKFFFKLPKEIKDLYDSENQASLKKFKVSLKLYLIENCFYNIGEFCN